jgi:acetyl esterase
MVAFSMIAAAKSYDNVEFGHAGGSSLQLDASVPDGPGPYPAIIIVHGGAWVAGDRKRSVEPLFEPLSAAGFAWFSISYRLANVGDPGSMPTNIASMAGLGAAVDDVRQAVTYVKKHASEYRIDPDHIALVGESAGAQLASMAALKPASGGAVQAVVAFYSPSDMAKLLETTPRVPDALRQVIKGSPFGDLLLASLRDLSPVNWVQKDSPPFLLIHGTEDRLVPFEQSKQMCDAMRMAGASCEVYAVNGGGHGLRWWESERDLTAYKQVMIRWLDSKLRLSKDN